MSQPRARAKLSKPGEHGGLVMLIAAAILVAVVAPQQLVAMAAALIYMIAYLARGPIERKARHFRLRDWDRPALAAYILAILGLAAMIARASMAMAAVVLATALGIPIIGAIVTRARVHRAFVIELIGLAACGASTGIALYVGGAALSGAVAASLAMGTYAASTVAMVRAEVRDLQDDRRMRVSRMGFFILLAGSAAVAIVSIGFAIAFVPRLARSAYQATRGPGTRAISFIAVRETGELAVFVALLGLGLLGLLPDLHGRP